MTHSTSRYWRTLLLIFFVIHFSACEDKKTEVQTEKVFREQIVEMVTGNGKIYPVTEVKISARVQGQITELSVEQGDSVRAGQVLLKLEREQYQASLSRARSALLEAKANLKLAEQALKRQQELFVQNLVSKADLETAEAQRDRSLSQVQQAQASVRETQDALERTIISSPIDGIVIRKNKEKGEIALGSAFQEDVILVVAQLSEMEVRIEINENDIVKVSEGDTTTVEIDAFPDTTFQAIVTDISNSAQVKGTGTIEEVTNFEVRVRLLDRLPAFRPGMSATADVATQKRQNAVNLPIQSVTVRSRSTLKQEEDDETARKNQSEETNEAPAGRKNRKQDDMIEVVFVVNNGVVEMRPVTLGISDDAYYEVLGGLEVDEEVVTGPYRTLSRDLKDGQDVTVNNRPIGDGGK